jgi:tetratricopeptide (TPR) repeat protein/tRNA A-37 threonylcarbamoyl transferase component Bud32
MGAAESAIEGACPDPDTIARFAARVLPAAMAAQVELHFADCDDCRTLVFALASGGQVPALGAAGEPSSVGRFRIDQTLGQGAMGIVYRARDLDLDRFVAVKVSRSQSRLDVGGEDRLRREAQALARLVHPNVIAIHEIGQHEGRAFVAMEYVDGPTLDAWVQGRAVSEILHVLVAAARGLAAAHAVGLVHRDVKPANIFVAGGTAKIGDFGLVRYEAVTEVRAPVEGSELEMTLSMAGSILGTPAYMAPEQLRGEVATEASDQFSFCVTMFEALFGKRPFEGATLAALRASFDQPVAPPTSTVPAWITSIVVRGLSLDPSNRWPSMTALVAALGDDPVATRRRRIRQITIGGVVAVLAGVAVVALARGGATSEPACAGFETKLAGVWDMPRTQQLRAAFARTTLPYASDVFARVAAQLDTYSRGWVDARVDACEATRVSGDQSEAQLELRMACLDRRLVDLGALVDVLGTNTNASVIQNSITATHALAPLADCANLSALAAGIELPADASARGRVAELQRKLGTVTALYETGQYKPGLTSAREVVDAAKPLQFAPVLAEALHLRARLEHGSGDAAAAVATYEMAIPAAADARDDVRVAQLWADLVHVLGSLARADDALKLRPAAEAAFKRAGSPPAVEIKLLASYGDVYSAQGKFADAQAQYERALAINDKALGPSDHRFASSLLNNLGIAQQQQGAFAEAVRTYRRALAIDEELLGPNHPMLAVVLVNIGVGLAQSGDYDGARPYDLRALAVLEKALGPDHPNVGAVVDNIGAGYLSQGRYDEARPYQFRAIAIFETSGTPGEPYLAGAMANLGVAYLAQHKHADARQAAERSLEIYKKLGGPDHPTVATPLLLLAAIDSARGQHTTALAFYQQALVIYEKAHGAMHPDVATALTGIAQESLALKRVPAARTAAERALKIREQPDMPGFELAETRWALARALWSDVSARSRARTLAEQAREGFIAAADAGAKPLADVTAWLAAR